MQRRRKQFRQIRMEVSPRTSILIPNNQFYLYSHRQKRDQQHRLGVYKEEQLRLQFKQLIPWMKSSQNALLLPHSTITKIRNRCIYTSRARGIFSKYRISRIVLKRYIELGLISGWQQIC